MSTIRNMTVICLLAALGAASAMAGVPDLDLSTATIPPGAIGASIFNLPNGLGATFTQGRLHGAVVNATVTLHLVDALNQPIAFYPSEDMWLDPTGSVYGLCICSAGTIADQSTDSNGDTYWQAPLEAGGCTAGYLIRVIVAGSALNQAGLNLIWVSADIDGDCIVNLPDISRFSGDFFGSYDVCSDFVYDGSINLSDVSMMAQGLGAGCQ